jgi:SAM-dependent methyltransferase
MQQKDQSMAGDPQTTAFYAAEAARYAARGTPPNTRHIERFSSFLVPNAAVLELGCGGGRDSAALIAKGLDLTPSDGSPELAAEAQLRLGRKVQVLRFADLAADAAFDGVYANACLLHVPRAELPAILVAIHRALRAGGVFYSSFKEGTQEGRDRLGRLYNYPSPDWLAAAFANAGFPTPEIEQTMGTGYDLEPIPWLHVYARKDASAT